MYEWIKALHLIAVISWMAGLFYLPRLFIYHCDAKINSEKSETFKIMERRLLNIIMTPAMMISWGAGLYLLSAEDWLYNGDIWIYIKLLCLIIMTILHCMLILYCHKFKLDENIKSSKFFRIINEIPTILMVIIIIMVIVKPF